ncbi:MAG: hypothetical protein V1645_03720 [archaeon]
METVEVIATEETRQDIREVAGGLNNIISRAEEAPHLEQLLISAVSTIYLAMPHGGENYSGTSPKLGKVALVPRKYPDTHGTIDIIFTPNPENKCKCKSEPTAIGSISIKEKKYWTVNDDGKKAEGIPEQVLEDTYTVMGALGLYNPKKDDTPF